MGSAAATINLTDSAALATVIGIPLATLTLALGYVQFRASLRAAALSHVNSLFRDLLRLEFDFYNAVDDGGAARQAACRRLHSYRMWVLEEMWVWLRIVAARRTWTRRARIRKRRFVRTWLHTMRYHARRNTVEEWGDFRRCRECYDPDFHAFVRRFERRPAPVA